MTEQLHKGFTQLAEMAEEALLGALLLDPRRLRDVAWLDPGDFSRPTHQALYRTLMGLVRDGIEIDLLALPDVLIQGKYHDLNPNQFSAFALMELIAHTPASPAVDSGFDVSGHSEHRRYAEIVLEQSIRRHVLDAGARIEQTAENLADPRRADLDTAIGAAQRALHSATTDLNALQQRLEASGPVTVTTSTPPSATPPSWPGVASSEQTQRAEYGLLAACITHPGIRAEAQLRLHAEDFATPEIAATWVALTQLTTAGGSVDAVLLAAQVQRLAAHPDYGPGLAPPQLATLARHSNIVAGNQALAAVTRAALARSTTQAQRALAEAAHDPQHTSHTALIAAHTALERARATHHRLDASATKSGPTREAPTPKALPPTPTPMPRPRPAVPIAPTRPTRTVSSTTQRHSRSR